LETSKKTLDLIKDTTAVQDASKPLLFNETPDFAEEPVLDKILDANISPEMQEARDHSQRCSSTWAVMSYICPKLGKAITLDYDLCCYLAGVSSGCSDDVISLRSLLADVSR
jgi:hypothetical protein